jgi:hypothetical protein
MAAGAHASIALEGGTKLRSRDGCGESALAIRLAVLLLLAPNANRALSAGPDGLDEVMQAVTAQVNPANASEYEAVFIMRDPEVVDVPATKRGMHTRRARLTWQGDDYWLAVVYDYDTTPSRTAALASYFRNQRPQGDAFHPRPVARFVSSRSGVIRTATLLRSHCVTPSGEPCGFTDALLLDRDSSGTVYMECDSFRRLILGHYLTQATLPDNARVARDADGGFLISGQRAALYPQSFVGDLNLKVSSEGVLRSGDFLSESGAFRVTFVTTGTVRGGGLLLPRHARSEIISSQIGTPTEIELLSVDRASPDLKVSARQFVERVMQLPVASDVFARDKEIIMERRSPDAVVPIVQELKASLDAP